MLVQGSKKVVPLIESSTCANSLSLCGLLAVWVDGQPNFLKSSINMEVPLMRVPLKRVALYFEYLVE